MKQLRYKRLLYEHSSEFVEWLERNKIRLKLYTKLAEVLEQYLRDHLSSSDRCVQLVNCLPSVHDECDNPETYISAMSTEAYAYAHFLERYRRFWDTLLILLQAKVLPMSNNGIDVLDIGTGPAPALYAVSDFYQAFNDFVLFKNYSSIATPLPRLHCIEASPYMWHFFHIFSEMSGRNGPFQATFKTFDGLDLAEERSRERKLRIKREEQDQDTSWEWATRYVNQMAPTNELFRYNLVIFSYFLTRKANVETWKNELRAIFQALRPNGVVIVGGIEKGYQDINDFVNDEALSAKLLKVSAIPKVPCNYSESYESYGEHLRQFYDTIWDWMRMQQKDIDQVAIELNKPKLKKFWTPSMRIKYSRQFSLQVFQKR